MGSERVLTPTPPMPSSLVLSAEVRFSSGFQPLQPATTHYSQALSHLNQLQPTTHRLSANQPPHNSHHSYLSAHPSLYNPLLTSSQLTHHFTTSQPSTSRTPRHSTTHYPQPLHQPPGLITHYSQALTPSAAPQPHPHL